MKDKTNIVNELETLMAIVHFSGPVVFAQKYIESNVSVASIKQFVVIVFTHAGPRYSCLVDDVGAVIFAMNVKTKPAYSFVFQRSPDDILKYTGNLR